MPPSENQHRRIGHHQSKREGQQRIGLVQPLGAGGGIGPLRGGGGHMGPDRGPTRQEERERPQPEIAGPLEIPVEQRIPKRVETVPVEVHQEKGEIEVDVDAAEVLVEFDGVEQQRYAVDDADIVQMEIAVTPAHAA